jgi:hypothetical protein
MCARRGRNEIDGERVSPAAGGGTRVAAHSPLDIHLAVRGARHDGVAGWVGGLGVNAVKTVAALAEHCAKRGIVI